MDAKGKNRKAFIAFITVLFMFLILINVLGIYHFKTTLNTTQSSQERKETELFQNFVISLIVQRDFAKIVDLVKDWGQSEYNVVKIKLSSSNKYVIAEYNADYKIYIPSIKTKKIKLDSNREFLLTIVFDRIKSSQDVNEITIKMMVISTIIFLFLSIILWKLLIRIAIIPLQQEALGHKKTADDLFVAKKEADKANKSKSEFLANMSHEIRTPMNGILGMLHLVRETDLTTEQQECISTANTSAQSLLVIINDILDFSKIESGKLDLEKTDFNLHETISNIAALFSELAFKKGLELAVDINIDVPTFVRGDPTRLGQIISNLVGNAIKFTEKGEIVIKVELKHTANDEIHLHFDIKDTGIGISKDVHDKIFVDFSQADTTTTRFYGGTGLGLSISKHLVELMGGNIGIASEVGVGSTFWFDIIAEKSELKSNDESNIVDFEKSRILIVDDNTTNCKILDKQLSSWSIPHDISTSGESALKMIDLALKEGNPYSCVLLDMMMPKMDGLQVASELEKLNSSSKIIMLSSGGTVDVVKALEDKLIQSYILKPVRSSILFDAISAVLTGKQKINTNKVLNSSDTLFDDKSVLIVEDNKINQRVITLLLKKVGINADIANNGLEALEKTKLKNYDLVFMDCHMPEMDGYAATKAIREMEKNDGTHLNIIAMTANAMKEDKDKCIAIGMDDYVSKPIKPDVLNECLVKWLGG